MEYKEEKKKLYKDFVKMYYYDKWNGERKREKGVYSSSLELFYGPSCNTECSYCYLKNFDKDLYPAEARGKEIYLKNTKIYFDFLTENYLWVPTIEIFGGEIFNLPYFTEIFDIIKEYVKKFPENIPSPVLLVPTNSTFLFKKDVTEKVEDLVKEFAEIGVRVSLSHSVDGKFMDLSNRKLRNTAHFNYDDEFYDKLFLFAKKHHSGFHPMIHSHGIEKWKENFEWWLENLAKSNGSEMSAISSGLYLLDVRNPDWSKQQLKDYYSFIKYLIKRTFKIYSFNKKEYADNFLFKNGLNLLGSVFSTIGRGIGCSIQSTMYLRIGDLNIVPCHRTSYEGYSGGKYIVKDDKIVDLEPINPEQYITVKTFDSQTLPVCEKCPINSLCNKFCLGVNFEVNKDLFSPSSNVCEMQFVKAQAIADVLEELSILPYLEKRTKNMKGLSDSTRQLRGLINYKKRRENNDSE